MPRPMYFIDDFKKINNEMYKRDVKRNEGSHNFGTTARDADGFTKLINALEEVETKSEISVATADSTEDSQQAHMMAGPGPRILPRGHVPDKITGRMVSGLIGLFASLKKANSLIASLKFKGLPKDDINQLQKYWESLQNYNLVLTNKENELSADENSNRNDVETQYQLVLQEFNKLNNRLGDSIMIYNSGATPTGKSQADPKTFVGGSLKGHPMYQNQEYI